MQPATDDAPSILPAAEDHRFRTVFDNAPIGMGLITREGQWVAVNAALCRFLGYEEAELLRHTFREVTHPEDLEADSAQFERLWSGQVDSYEIEKRYIRKDGRVVCGLLSRALLRRPDGTSEFAISQVVDMTERKRLRDETMFIIEAGQVLSGSLDREEIVRALARLAVPRLADWCVIDLVGERGERGERDGIRTAEIVAADPHKEKLLRALRSRYPLGSDQMPEPFERVLNTGKAVVLSEVKREQLEGAAVDSGQAAILRELHSISFMVVPLVARGRVNGVLTMGSSESGRRFEAADLRLAEELASSAALALENALLYRQAQAAAKARDELVGFIAHDLRTPVAAAAVCAERLQDPALPPEERRKVASAISEATELMTALTKDLLDATLIASGALRVDAQPTRAMALLLATVDLFEVTARAKGIVLRTEGDDLPVVLADHERIQQVLCNLLANAIRLTPEGGTITLRARRVTDRVVFSVSDTGPGIPADHIPHLFDRLWQGQRGRRGGAGLGLAIAKGIVEAHGGEIWAQSEPGQGATFSFSLLVWRGAGPHAPAHTVVKVPPAPERQSVRVLVVDDEPVTRIGVAELLSADPAITVVGQASSGEQAVDLTRTEKPDVVVMDLLMPGIGGIEATRRILAMDPRARVLTLTGLAGDVALTDALQAGARGFLRKTATPESLAAAVRSVARGELVLDPGAAPLLQARAGATMAGAPANPLQVLSEQERKVLALTAQGYSAVQASRKLFLSPKTVETYRSRAMRKLGLSSRADLIAFAVRTRLLSA